MKFSSRIFTTTYLFRFLFYVSIAFILVCQAPRHHVQAEGEFYTDYSISYSVAPNGATAVIQNVTLTNKLSNLYPKEYTITIDSEHITRVLARDDDGQIVPKISQQDGKTFITLVFNKEVVGFGKQLTFSLRYESADIAKQNGRIWEINIPGVENDDSLRSYNVDLVVPQQFGKAAYLSPKPKNGTTWTKEQMVAGGVSAAYGESQLFTMKLSYYLANMELRPVTSEIALPPDTAYQKITITSLDPKPENVIRDADGNWLAQYHLLPGTRTQVSAVVSAEISLTPRTDYNEVTENMDIYLKPQEYWELNNEIMETAHKYKTPRAIYEYVSQTLVYNYDRINQSLGRFGAAKAIQNPQSAICMEFTDLFIALARANGIPAREVVGYAYTDNPKLRPLSLVSDVLHSWPEYYDKALHRWIQVDPTWGNTTGGVNYFDKLDFNHIAFAIHGISSTYPYPAGFYKEAGKIGKDVLVEFGKDVPNGTSRMSASIHFPTTVIAGIRGSGTIEIENTSGVSVKQADISIESLQAGFLSKDTLFNVPPYAKFVYPITLHRDSLVFPLGVDELIVTVNGETFVHSFQVRSVLWIALLIVFVATGGIIFFWFLRMRKIRKLK